MTTNELRALRAMAMPRYALDHEDSPPPADRKSELAPRVVPSSESGKTRSDREVA